MQSSALLNSDLDTSLFWAHLQTPGHESQRANLWGIVILRGMTTWIMSGFLKESRASEHCIMKSYPETNPQGTNSYFDL